VDSVVKKTGRAGFIIFFVVVVRRFFFHRE
jgi:hypothetical protein